MKLCLAPDLWQAAAVRKNHCPTRPIAPRLRFKQVGPVKFGNSPRCFKEDFMQLRTLAMMAALAGLTVAPAKAQEDLPKASFTAAQADAGRAEYQKSCLDCHGANLDDGEFGGPPLRGSSFESTYFGFTADGLYGFIKTAMPPDRPGRLSDKTYADVTAYILSKNGVQPGANPLPSDLEALAGLVIEK
jgi:mono/diheme cytochrome c family protein